MSNETLLQVGLVLFACALGSLPFGFWIAKLAAKDGSYDIRSDGKGSGGTGFTNVKRLFGMKWGAPVFVLDVAKSLVLALYVRNHFGLELAGICVFAAAFGHAKSWCLAVIDRDWVFSGGRSVSTMLGGLIVLNPWVALASLATYYVVKKLTKYVSLGSMAGSFIPLVYSIAFGLDGFWVKLYLALFGLIVYNHRRNIARLLSGTERKDGEKVEYIPPVGFGIHPIYVSDLDQAALSRWMWRLFKAKILPMAVLYWVLCQMPVIENAEITGIEIRDGRKTRVLIESIFLLPAWIKLAQRADLADCGRLVIVKNKAAVTDKKKQISRGEYKRACSMRKRLWKRLKSAAVQARRRGVEVLGLGALLSTVFNGGADLQKWCDSRNLGLTIDNGAAYTAVATVEAVIAEYGKSLEGVRVTVFGGTGFIGRITVKRLQQLGAIVTVIGRDKDRLGEFDEGVIASADPKDAYGSDIVVLVTSSEEPIITLGNCMNFKPGTLFIDTAVPVNFDDAILTAHPEMGFKLVRGGVTQLPGENVESKLDMHFDADGVRYYPACLAGTIMSHFATKEERAKHVSCGARVSEADFDFYAQKAKEYGIVVYTNRKAKVFVGEEEELN